MNPVVANPDLKITCHSGDRLHSEIDRWRKSLPDEKQSALTYDPRWLAVLHDSMQQQPYCIEATAAGKTVGLLPLAYLNTRLFGRFLVSLPYLNSAGVIVADDDVAVRLIDRAVELADELSVRYLELRHERRIEHPALNFELTQKVHHRLSLPTTAEELFHAIGSKVRNQVRKGERNGLAVHWGRGEMLRDFYRIFSSRMRDLGTPVYPRRLFACILERFPDETEICLIRDGDRPLAAALLTHGTSVTEVPTAAALTKAYPTNANMLMYWHLLKRTVERGQQTFDFGRSSIGSSTERFKEQWGPRAEPAIWQYYVRQGKIEDMRPDSSRNQRRIRVWQRLPLWITRLAGPRIVRGIP